MFDHISLGVQAPKKSAALYDAMLGALGIKRFMAEEPYAYGYKVKDMAFWICLPLEEKPLPSPCNGTHFAFKANSRALVDAFYEAAIKAGATCDGKPGPRPEYGDTYYAAFIRDFDGHKIEAVHR